MNEAKGQGSSVRSQKKEANRKGGRGTWLSRLIVVAAVLGLSANSHVTSNNTNSNSNSGISNAAYPLLAERVTANRTSFYVYQDADSGFNHGFPSGLFGTASKIHLDTACVDDPNSANGCPTDLNRLDRERGTVLRISFDPFSPGQFAGVNIEEPENWGVLRTGMGYDLHGATHVKFDVRSPTPGGIKVRFGVGGRTSNFIHIPQGSTYTTMSIPLDSLGLSSSDLADVHILFIVVTNDINAPNGGTVLLDNIRFEPVPSRQQSDPKALSFPREH